MDINAFKEWLERLKRAILDRPDEKLYIDDLARATGIDQDEMNELYELFLEIDAILLDVEIDRDIRGKYFMLNEYQDEEEDEYD